MSVQVDQTKMFNCLKNQAFGKNAVNPKGCNWNGQPDPNAWLDRLNLTANNAYAGYGYGYFYSPVSNGSYSTFPSAYHGPIGPPSRILAIGNLGDGQNPYNASKWYHPPTDAWTPQF